MSGAFVFTPTSEPLAFTTPPYSPFIPSPSLFPGTPSPYTAHVPLPPAADDSYYEPNAGAGWPQYPYAYPYQHPYPYPYPQTPTQPEIPPLGGIANNLNYYPYSLYNLYTPPPPQRAHQLHPWLDGVHPRSDLWFDLSTTLFAPMRILSPTGARIPLTLPDLSAPATHPPCYALHIAHDACPWPMVIGTGSTPLSLGDVLLWVYRYMQLSISHEDWGRLEEGERREVGRWWRRRCGGREEERVRGVKRVDYLGGRVLFRGLVVDWGRGVLSMVTV